MCESTNIFDVSMLYASFTECHLEICVYDGDWTTSADRAAASWIESCWKV